MRELELKHEQLNDPERRGEPIAQIWECPKCRAEGISAFKSKWTRLRKSSRYLGLDDRCKVCGRKTRNILPHVKRTLPERREGVRMAQELTDGICEWEAGA